MTKDEALKLALEVLEYWDVHGKLHQPTEEAITAIKEALAQPEQEPVAEIVSNVNGFLSTQWSEKWSPNPGDKLYTTPPQRKPLTDEEIINKCLDSGFERNSLGWSFTYGKLDYHLLKLARAIEAAHGIKENT